MSAKLFHEHFRHVCFVSVAGRNSKNRLCHESFRKQQVLLLRNRGSCGRDAGGDTETAECGTARNELKKRFKRWVQVYILVNNRRFQINVGSNLFIFFLKIKEEEVM